MTIKRVLRKCGYIFLTLFVLANIMAAFHAWKFTHFSPGLAARTGDEASLSFGEKVEALLTGVSLPRPENRTWPDGAFETISLQSNKRIECWRMAADSAIGTVIIFHGYGGSKASMLDKAEVFRKMHYNVLLADFMGAGGSEGDQTTIGYKEAAQVKTCIDYVAGRGERNIALYGTSLGAAAIMKAMHDGAPDVRRVILECPFGTMLRTVQNRFKMLDVPAFPMAQLLVFWGGVENGFNAFSHNPEDYAGSIRCPALLIYGARDAKVSLEETAAIFRNLAGPKRLLTLPGAGHENYLKRYRNEWTAAVDSFLQD
jgi:alpha-beta hydrolase superfamily lysophospholipase